ncbi:MAG: type II secretion system protein, partial [Myxococcota bacterium]
SLGFTLVELMVVLAVMGVLVSAALPSIGQGFADRRVAIVAREVVGLFQRARYMSSAYGRAHQVSYINDDFGLRDPFAFETLRGTAASCSVSRFDNAGGVVIDDLNCDGNAHWRCVDHVYASDFDPNTGDNDEIRVEGWTDSTYCYESGSNNQTFVGSALFSNWDTSQASKAGHGFLVYREVGGTAVGVPRKIIVPSGTGVPRILR